MSEICVGCKNEIDPEAESQYTPGNLFEEITSGWDIDNLCKECEDQMIEDALA
jgi:hypothetical protein